MGPMESESESAQKFQDAIADLPSEQEKRGYQPKVTWTLTPLSSAQRAQLRGPMFILRILEARVRTYGSIRKCAESLGVSKSFLSFVLRGKKPPGYHMVRMLGYIPVTLYKRVPFDEDVPVIVAGSKERQANLTEQYVRAHDETAKRNREHARRQRATRARDGGQNRKGAFRPAVLGE